jgi:hypothetical protein
MQNAKRSERAWRRKRRRIALSQRRNSSGAGFRDANTEPTARGTASKHAL